MRLLKLRIERPRSRFVMKQTNRLINLRVHIDSLPIFIRCRGSERPKFNGKRVYESEHDFFSFHTKRHMQWDTLPESVQEAYNGAIAENYNRRLKYVFDSDSLDAHS